LGKGAGIGKMMACSRFRSLSCNASAPWIENGWNYRDFASRSAKARPFIWYSGRFDIILSVETREVPMKLRNARLIAFYGFLLSATVLVTSLAQAGVKPP
jgi:hypothetical protein